MSSHVEVAASTAVERTYLAWSRSAISWAGAGAFITRIFIHNIGEAMVGVVMMICGALMWGHGFVIHRRRHAALTDGRVETFVGSGMAWVTGAVVVTIAASIIARLWTWTG